MNLQSAYWLYPFSLLVLVGCASPDTRPGPANPDAEAAGTAVLPLQHGERIVFFGDSITQAGVEPGGYVTLIDQALQERYPDLAIEVIGAGISGNKVPDLLARLDRDVLSRDPSLVVVYIGINDVWHWFDFDAGTEKDVYESGLEELVNRIQAAGSRVLLCTPSVIGEAPDFSSEEDAMLEAYADVSRAVAGRSGIPVCDLRESFKEALRAENTDGKNQGIFTTDRVHLNERGNALVADQILSLLGRAE